MVIAALVFEAGICRDDPARILTYPLRRLLFWYELCTKWRALMNKEQQKAAQQREPTQPVVRRLPR